eukprot:5118325-Prymnesium_polylepis.1
MTSADAGCVAKNGVTLRSATWLASVSSTFRPDVASAAAARNFSASARCMCRRRRVSLQAFRLSVPLTVSMPRACRWAKDSESSAYTSAGVAVRPMASHQFSASSRNPPPRAAHSVQLQRRGTARAGGASFRAECPRKAAANARTPSGFPLPDGTAGHPRTRLNASVGRWARSCRATATSRRRGPQASLLEY